MSIQFTTTDQYGRSIIVTLKGKYLKGYLLSYNMLVDHCLVNEFGLVFSTERFGWNSIQHNQNIRLKVFTHQVERDNDFNNNWSWEGWYEQNWLCDFWAQIYSKVCNIK